MLTQLRLTHHLQYIPSRELENATSALNFTTSDCRVVGGCDLYTTKAAGSDKKLHKNIEQSLQSQHESLIRLSESLSPPNAEIFSLNLSRSSPFGPLSQVSSRRTFAYLIATLNASHPDYEFSHFLRPSDFRKERNLKAVMHTVDDTLYNLRPRSLSTWSPQAYNSYTPNGVPQTPGGSTTWTPRIWKMIDKEMSLRECEIYRYSPEEDPFDGEESAIWSHNYFFFNKERRRVLYIHFRGLSPAAYAPAQTPLTTNLKRARPVSRSLSFSDSGASKRARFWLGDKADRCVSEPVWGEDDEDDDFVIADPGDDEVDAIDAYDEDDQADFATDEGEEDDEIEKRFRDRTAIRSVSQEAAHSIDV